MKKRTRDELTRYIVKHTPIHSMTGTQLGFAQDGAEAVFDNMKCKTCSSYNEEDGRMTCKTILCEGGKRFIPPSAEFGCNEHKTIKD